MEKKAVSGTTPDEQMWRMLNLRVDTMLKAEQLRWEPWKVVAAAAAAGGGFVAGWTAVIGLMLHLMGKI
jgi:hypothetical protein